MTINVFVVRHTPSGKFLPPARVFKSATRQEPSDQPRIFYKERDAKVAASWWARGIASANHTSEWERSDREAPDIQSEPVAGRRLGDLEICEATLTINGDKDEL